MDFLEDLEVKELKRKQGTIPETKDNTQKIIELRRKRDSLKMQLQAVDKMLEESNIATEEESQEEEDDEELKKMKDQYEEMCTLMDCYRLTGFSVFSIDDTKLIFSYDTSYLGKCCETYYLEMEDLQNEKFVVRRHSFPPFVPVDELEKTLLKDQPRWFLMKLSDYLFTYIARREETKITLDRFKDFLTVNNSEPYDYIELKIGEVAGPLQLEFQISFTDLLTSLPSKCSIATVVDDDKEGHSMKPKQKLITKWHTLIQTERLSVAVDTVIEDYKKLLRQTLKE